MLGPRYVETSQLVQQERQRERNYHLRRLQAIGSRSPKPSQAHLTPKTCQSGGFLQAARLDDIRRANNALFSRLLAISRGRYSGQEAPQAHRSLNSLNRRREDQKIAEENSQLAQRIISQSGFPSAKQLHQSYQSIQKYRYQLSRVRPAKTTKPRVRPRQSRSVQQDTDPSKGERRQLGRNSVADLRV